MSTESPKVAIIGGGVAGLTVACVAVSRGARVTLFEQKAHGGGRTFSFLDPVTGVELDNGQHVILGCYLRTRSFLELISVYTRLTEKPLDIEWRERDQELSSLRVANGSKISLALALLRQRHMGFLDRMYLLLGLSRAGRVKPFPDECVKDWLDRLGQPRTVKKYFWNPVCLAVMNESMENAVGTKFATVLKKVFFGSGNSSSFLWSSAGLSTLIVNPAMNYLSKAGATIRLGSKVESWKFDSSSATVSIGGESDTFDFVVSTVPPWNLDTLLRSDLGIPYKVSSILSGYVWFAKDQNVSAPLTGCIGTTVQWITWKGPRLGAVTVSAANELDDLGKKELEKLVRQELTDLLRIDPGEIERVLLLRERRATVSISGLNKIPTVPGLIIAGDWTIPELPCTIESACESAYRAVDRIYANPVRA